MERFDLLHFIHKAMRHAMLTTNIQSGRVDYADGDSAQRMRESWSSLCVNLGNHAHHEDAIIFPLLETRSPGETVKLTGDHAVIHALEAGMTRLLDDLCAERDTATRRVLGREFHRSMQHYTAVCLDHFDDEERHLMPRLWALYDDDALQVTFGQIMATVGSDERDFTMANLTQALDPVELVAFRVHAGV
jgi:hypothetical protein